MRINSQSLLLLCLASGAAAFSVPGTGVLTSSPKTNDVTIAANTALFSLAVEDDVGSEYIYIVHHSTVIFALQIAGSVHLDGNIMRQYLSL